MIKHIVKDFYRNDTDKGGRPNVDEVVMIKTLSLPSMYNCSDEIIERELHDRISFRNFLHYLVTITDSRTTWLFIERLSSTGKDKIIWKQLEEHGITLKREWCRMNHSLNPISVNMEGRNFLFPLIWYLQKRRRF
jgi:IS5 family transposase